MGASPNAITRFSVRLVCSDRNLDISINGITLGTLYWIPPKGFDEERKHCFVHVEEEDLSYDRISFWPEPSELTPARTSFQANATNRNVF